MCKLPFALLALPILAVMAAPKPEAKPEAKPGVLAAAPVLAAPAVIPNVATVTAQSSQVFTRNFNALAVPVAAPAPLVAAAAPAPLVAAPASAPLLASPYAASPYAFASPYLTSPYVGPQYFL